MLAITPDGWAAGAGGWGEQGLGWLTNGGMYWKLCVS